MPGGAVLPGMLRSRISLTALALSAGLSLSQPALALPGPGATETLRYSWSLKGALAWVARVAFPGSGTGTLETSAADGIRSRLTITTPNQKGYAFYDSRMSADGRRTFASADGYSWLNRSEEQRVTFDYGSRVATIEKRSADGVEQKTRRLEHEAPQDVLTSIYYLRQNADQILQPRRAQVYSGGKPYAFLFTPRPVTTMKVANQQMRVRPFAITPVGGQKKGTVRVWLSDDARRVPVRIEIEQNHATLKLELL